MSGSNKQERRQRYLSRSELARLAEVLADEERLQTTSSVVIAAIRLLLLTGCRRGEILTLRWQDVDLERRCLHLPDSKTGQKTGYLNTAAIQVLEAIEPVDGSPYILPGLDDLRLHDLRHTFASIGVNAGLSLPVVGKLLGHTQVTTTERYSQPGRRSGAPGQRGHRGDAAGGDGGEGRRRLSQLAAGRVSLTVRRCPTTLTPPGTPSSPRRPGG